MSFSVVVGFWVLLLLLLFLLLLLLFNMVSPFGMSYPSNFAPIPKLPTDSLQPVPITARFQRPDIFYSPNWRCCCQYFHKSRADSLGSELSTCTVKWLFCSSTFTCVWFFSSDSAFSNNLSFSNIHSKEWELTITSPITRLLLPIVKPVVLGVARGDDWDSDQENFHYFISPNG